MLIYMVWLYGIFSTLAFKSVHCRKGKNHRSTVDTHCIVPGSPSTALNGYFLFFYFNFAMVCIYMVAEQQREKKLCLPPMDILVKMTMKKKFCSLPNDVKYKCE